MATSKTLSIEAVVRRSEMVGTTQRNDILYRISNALGFSQEDVVTWKLPNNTVALSSPGDFVQLNFPPGMTSADGLLIRVNKKAGADDMIKIKLNDEAAPILEVREVLVWMGTNVTEVWVRNDTGSVVDVMFHLFSDE